MHVNDWVMDPKASLGKSFQNKQLIPTHFSFTKKI